MNTIIIKLPSFSREVTAYFDSRSFLIADMIVQKHISATALPIIPPAVTPQEFIKIYKDSGRSRKLSKTSARKNIFTTSTKELK